MHSSQDPAACSGFSRRTFFRFAAGASALASMPMLTEPRLAFAARPHFTDPNIGIHIDANENPMGPCESARQAIIDIVPRGGRYLFPLETSPQRSSPSRRASIPSSDSVCRVDRAAALHRARLYQQRQAARHCRPRL